MAQPTSTPPLNEALQGMMPEAVFAEPEIVATLSRQFLIEAQERLARRGVLLEGGEMSGVYAHAAG